MQIELHINNQVFTHFLKGKINLTMESVCDAFELTFAQKHDSSLDIGVGMPCEVFLKEDNTSKKVLTGCIDRLNTVEESARSIVTLYGRSKVSALVDGEYDPIVQGGTGQWNNIRFDELARKWCEPLGISVVVDEGLEMPIIETARYTQDNLHESLKHYSIPHNLLTYSNPEGQLLITRASTKTPTMLFESGKNLLKIRTTVDHTGIYSKYIVTGSRPSIQGEDERRSSFVKEIYVDPYASKDKTLCIEYDGPCTPELAQQRALFEAMNRRAMAERVNITVSGWHALKDCLVKLKSESYDNADMRAVQSTLLIDKDDGARTQITLTDALGWADTSTDAATAPKPSAHKMAESWAENQNNEGSVLYAGMPGATGIMGALPIPIGSADPQLKAMVFGASDKQKTIASTLTEEEQQLSKRMMRRFVYVSDYNSNLESRGIAKAKYILAQAVNEIVKVDIGKSLIDQLDREMNKFGGTGEKLYVFITNTSIGFGPESINNGVNPQGRGILNVSLDFINKRYGEYIFNIDSEQIPSWANHRADDIFFHELNHALEFYRDFNGTASEAYIDYQSDDGTVMRSEAERSTVEQTNLYRLQKDPVKFPPRSHYRGKLTGPNSEIRFYSSRLGFYNDWVDLFGTEPPIIL